MGDNPSPLVRGNSMFYSTLFLSGGTIALRIVQMGFQVYISGVMGADGLGIMHLITTVGTLAAVLASGGVRIAATCLIAEEGGMDSVSGVRAAVRCCLLYGGGLSLMVSLLLFSFSTPIAQRWISSAEAGVPLRIVAVFLPVTCASAVLAGYYTAAGRITELVSVELFERILSVGLVSFLIQSGSADPCTAVFLGSSLASLTSLVFLLFRFRRFMRGVAAAPMLPMMKRLLRFTLPLGFNDVLRSGINTVEHMLIPHGLKKHGASETDSLAAYGTISAMVFPVITFPNVILYSLSDVLIPELARCRAKGQLPRIQALTGRCLRFSVVFSAAAAGICFSLGNDLGELLFHSQDAGTNIRIYAPLIPILYLDTITDGMLKGLSQQIHSVRYNTLTSLLDVAMIFLLLPQYGMQGFLTAFTVSHALNFFLSIRRLLLVTQYRPRFDGPILTGLCSVVSLMAVRLLPPGGGTLILVWKAAAFLTLYLLLVRLTGAVSQADTDWLIRLVRHRETARS
ncbi:MAG: oligosaccharide flippase family protein [Oscillospiraceae bacterium]|nr:oligosaccharide flippase family protein [Oscillospiraceae bacterium]